MSKWEDGVRGRAYRKIVVTKLSTDFREATQIVSACVPRELQPREVVLKVLHAGVNASDINYSAGFYTPGKKPPLDAGFEAVGRVVACGAEAALHIPLGSPMAATGHGAFGEYLVLPSYKTALPVPSPDASMIPLLVSGLTASVALEHVGEIKSGETVLVTAAAGGTGQFAVQLAKAKGCHVVGTCSSEKKQEFLRRIGCDRAINYKKEDLHRVLKKEYPNGVDVVYESVGGATFDACVSNLAVKGRLIVIGMISGYTDGSAWKATASGGSLTAKLLTKSASVRGFFLNHYTGEWKRHLALMAAAVQRGDLVPGVDPSPFEGLEEVPLAIDHLYAGLNLGKVVVRIPHPPASRL